MKRVELCYVATEKMWSIMHDGKHVGFCNSVVLKDCTLGTVFSGEIAPVRPNKGGWRLYNGPRGGCYLANGPDETMPLVKEADYVHFQPEGRMKAWGVT